LRSAHHHARLCHGADAGLHGPGDAEVHHLDHAAFVQHHIARLDVPVHQAHAVALGQRRQHIPGDLQRLLGRHRAELRDILVEYGAQRLALDVLHHDVRHQDAVDGVLAGVEDRDYIGVIQLGDGLRLAPEPLAE
jgi:hypothetical protein